MEISYKNDEKANRLTVRDGEFSIGETPVGETRGIRGELNFYQEKKVVEFGPLAMMAALSRGQEPPEPETVLGKRSFSGRLFVPFGSFNPGETFRLIANGIGDLVFDADVCLTEIEVGTPSAYRFEGTGAPRKFLIAGVDLTA